jgi:hypothetical protein
MRPRQGTTGESQIPPNARPSTKRQILARIAQPTKEAIGPVNFFGCYFFASAGGQSVIAAQRAPRAYVQADSPLASATSTLRATRHGDSSVGTGLHALYGQASGPVPLRYRRAQSDLLLNPGHRELRAQTLQKLPCYVVRAALRR